MCCYMVQFTDVWQSLVVYSTVQHNTTMFDREQYCVMQYCQILLETVGAMQ